MKAGTAIPERIAFVDLETTGATATADRITEVGIVRVDGDTVSEWSTLVNPQARISEFIERLTGISNTMVESAPTFEAIAEDVRARLDGCLFVAHNARFDHGFLKNEFKRVGIDFRPTVLCTVKLSRKLEPQHQRHNLDALIARHGLIADGRHRALADAQLIHQLWHKLRARHPEATVAAALRELTARPSLPPQIDAAMVDELPEGPGVYLFYGDNELPLYVGRSRHIRQRVLAHFSADHAKPKEMDMALQVRRIDAITTSGELGAALHEAELVRRLQPLHNKQLRRVDELCSWRLADHGDGLFMPEIVAADAIAFSENDDAYGLFPSPRDARRSLTQLAREHGLCLVTLGLEQNPSGRACFAQPLGNCRGACIGKEAAATHSARLMAALASMKLRSWPFPGPALLAEGETIHVVDRWRHLGSASNEVDLWALRETSLPPFDRDSYRILLKAASRMTPWVTNV